MRSGIYFRVQRDGKWQPVEVDQLTSDERHDQLKDKDFRFISVLIDRLCAVMVEPKNPLPQDVVKILEETAKFLRECGTGYFAPDQANRFAEMIEARLLAV